MDQELNDIVGLSERLKRSLEAVTTDATTLAEKAQAAAAASQQAVAGAHAGPDFLVVALTVLALACFVGYYVVWNVTPALHSPLMGVTNAISSVIIVGAMIAAGPDEFSFAQIMGFLAVILASVNIFGGFMVTHRMLSMFKRKEKPASAKG